MSCKNVFEHSLDISSRGTLTSVAGTTMIGANDASQAGHDHDRGTGHEESFINIVPIYLSAESIYDQRLDKFGRAIRNDCLRSVSSCVMVIPHSRRWSDNVSHTSSQEPDGPLFSPSRELEWVFGVEYVVDREAMLEHDTICRPGMILLNRARETHN
jgi:hypothetical protein